MLEIICIGLICSCLSTTESTFMSVYTLDSLRIYKEILLLHKFQKCYKYTKKYIGYTPFGKPGCEMSQPWKGNLREAFQQLVETISGLDPENSMNCLSCLFQKERAKQMQNGKGVSFQSIIKWCLWDGSPVKRNNSIYRSQFFYLFVSNRSTEFGHCRDD